MKKKPSFMQWTVFNCPDDPNPEPPNPVEPPPK
jgi:hypothetical protein